MPAAIDHEAFMSEVSSSLGSDIEGGESKKNFVLSAKNWTLEEMKVFVGLYKDRFAAMGEPQATPAYPLPQDVGCKFCHRSRRNINTIPAGTYLHNPFLPFKSVSAHECVSCRMAQLWGLKDVPRSTLLEKLGGDEESSSEGDEFQIVYIFIVACWEIRYVDPNAAIFKTCESLPSACANTFKIVKQQALRDQNEFDMSCFPLFFFQRPLFNHLNII
jgi:hypothetical protein